MEQNCRVLQIIERFDDVGRYLMNWYRCMDHDRVQFDVLILGEGDPVYEEEIASYGGQVLHLSSSPSDGLFSFRSACKDFFKQHRATYTAIHAHTPQGVGTYLKYAYRANAQVIAHSHTGLIEKHCWFAAREKADYYFACNRDSGFSSFGGDIVDKELFVELKPGVLPCDAAAAVPASTVPRFGIAGLQSGKSEVQQFAQELFTKIQELQPSSMIIDLDFEPKVDLNSLDAFALLETKIDIPYVALEAQALGLPCALTTALPDIALTNCLSTRIPFSAGVHEWAQWMVGACQTRAITRGIDAMDEIRANGFDATRTAAWLQDFYISLM